MLNLPYYHYSTLSASVIVRFRGFSSIGIRFRLRIVTFVSSYSGALSKATLFALLVITVFQLAPLPAQPDYPQISPRPR